MKNSTMMERNPSNKYLPMKNDSINYDTILDMNKNLKQVHLTLDNGITNRKSRLI